MSEDVPSKLYDDIRGPKWDLSKIPDQSGKVVLVTGANAPGSIGWNVAHELAKKGAKVFIHARSAEKAQGAIDAILKESPSVPKAQLGTFVAEFTELKEVKTAAETFASTEPRLDTLYNVAGLLSRPLDKAPNGISISILVNHLAPFVLTTTLLPLLKKTAATGADVRIVTVASTTHTILPHSVRLRNLEDYNISFGAEDGLQYNLQRYGLSKLLNVLMAKELQRRLDAENIPIISLSLHPGGVNTPGAVKFIYGYCGGNQSILDNALTALEGSQTPLFAGTAPEVKAEKVKYAGSYLMPFGVPSPDDEAEDAKNAELAVEAWASSEKIVADVLAQ
jgi:NAD(P)-dependent dehydrogenase (short-subunit alcohol dehydrogenase family)